jgi:hypothetical protein
MTRKLRLLLTTYQCNSGSAACSIVIVQVILSGGHMQKLHNNLQSQFFSNLFGLPWTPCSALLIYSEPLVHHESLRILREQIPQHLRYALLAEETGVARMFRDQ